MTLIGALLGVFLVLGLFARRLDGRVSIVMMVAIACFIALFYHMG